MQTPSENCYEQKTICRDAIDESYLAPLQVMNATNTHLSNLSRNIISGTPVFHHTPHPPLHTVVPSFAPSTICRFSLPNITNTHSRTDAEKHSLTDYTSPHTPTHRQPDMHKNAYEHTMNTNTDGPAHMSTEGIGTNKFWMLFGELNWLTRKYFIDIYSFRLLLLQWEIGLWRRRHQPIFSCSASLKRLADVTLAHKKLHEMFHQPHSNLHRSFTVRVQINQGL